MGQSTGRRHFEAPCTKVQSRHGGIPGKKNVYYCSSLANPRSHAAGGTGNALAVHIQVDTSYFPGCSALPGDKKQVVSLDFFHWPGHLPNLYTGAAEADRNGL